MPPDSDSASSGGDLQRIGRGGGDLRTVKTLEWRLVRWRGRGRGRGEMNAERILGAIDESRKVSLGSAKRQGGLSAGKKKKKKEKEGVFAFPSRKGCTVSYHNDQNLTNTGKLLRTFKEGCHAAVETLGIFGRCNSLEFH